MHSIICLCTGHRGGEWPIATLPTNYSSYPEEADRVLLVPGPSGMLNKTNYTEVLHETLLKQASANGSILLEA